MRNKISLTINGNTNIKLRPSNMSLHLLRSIMRSQSVIKMMNVKNAWGMQVQDEVRVPLTPAQACALSDEWMRRRYV
jgi:hypothetical protein